jgi:hypothetical protein
MLDENLGYYTCNGQTFVSKINAFLHGRTTGKPVDWVFHDDVFSKYPWHIEPEIGLDDLYDARARQLREKYDYVVLSYSGGSDTHNILESFIRQGLHIDEIVINHMTSATQATTVLDPRIKDSWNFAAEHQLQAVPRLQYIRDQLPRTRITELDVSEVVINSMRTTFNDVDWVLGRNDHLSIGQLFRYNYFHFGEIKKRFDQDLSVVIIVGIDKPKCHIDTDGNFWLTFLDGIANITTINDFNVEYTNTHTEMFYWSPDSLDMLSKQAHLVKHWLEANPKYQPGWQGLNIARSRMLQERILRTLLYSTWDNTWYQANKSTSFWQTEFDTWFHNRADLAREQQLWRHGVNHLENILGEYIMRNDKGQASGLKPFMKSYLIGQMKSVV